MQTCPQCNNVLMSPRCSTHVCSQVPLVFSLSPGLFGLHCNPNATTHLAVPSAMVEESCLERDDIKCQGLSSLPTPHVSGHMFQFPSMNDALSPHLSRPCQLTCQINCLTHATSTYNAILLQRLDSCLWNSCRIHIHLNNDAIGSESDDDILIEASRTALKKSGWYWANLSWREAESVLQSTSVGTFLVRDSADPEHKFSLSVQTEKGPTSVRIHFSNGKFRFTSEVTMKSSLPEYSCIVRLIEHYVRANETHRNHVWLDGLGRIYSPVRIHRPLRKDIPPLSHLCRLVVNLCFPRAVTSCNIPASLVKYLDEYPHWC